MSEANIKDALQQALVHLNNLQDRKPYFDLYDDNSLVMHGLPPNLPTNKDGLKTFYMGLFQAFPDLNVKFDDVIVEGNKAAARFTMTGTQKGKFLGIPPNNKPIKVQGMSLFAFSGSKCVERWELVDMLSMMEQLSPRQQISAIMSGILEFAEVKANKELKDKITGLFKRQPQQKADG
jgi:steroid delta-isomerase-like uncharacterized protein